IDSDSRHFVLEYKRFRTILTDFVCREQLFDPFLDFDEISGVKQVPTERLLRVRDELRSS
ncbi:hypothetical protein QR98_0089810, partial [Sarcoptes scabiei]